MQKHYPLFYIGSLLGIFLAVSGCKQDPKEKLPPTEKITLEYAQGFHVKKWPNGFTEISVNGPWPDAERGFTYALVPKSQSLDSLDHSRYDAIIPIPVERYIATSTTHIPALEALGVHTGLVGFPGTDYISSMATRDLIRKKQVEELGLNESINTERVLALQPELVIGFGVDGQNKVYNTLQNANIPVVYNGEWVEQSPLGRAEWIKFFAPFFGKEKEADSIFNSIQEDYYAAKELAAQAQDRPTVLSGALYKDVWHLPAGDSWAAKFVADSNAQYLWADSPGTGSLSLGLEAVLEKGTQADFWIAPSQHTNYADLGEANRHYSQFKAFQEKQVYSYAMTRGRTGGLLYFELGPNRPDLILKDLVHIFHPELLPDYQPFFFKPLE